MPTEKPNLGLPLCGDSANERSAASATIIHLYRVTILYTIGAMIKTFRHKGLQRFFETGSKAGIQAAHAARLRLQLGALDQAIRPQDLSAPSWDLHPLKGNLDGHWAITVNGNWRMIFAFDGTDAILVDYRDYH